MTEDRLPVYAATREDAIDMARRRWEREGLRMGDVREVRRSCPPECENALHYHLVVAAVDLRRVP